MRLMRSILSVVLLVSCLPWMGCAKPKPYGFERRLSLATRKQQVWAVAPAVNLSGQEEVDPILQADALYGQLQQVQGLTVIPVNRVVEVYTALRIEKVQSAEQAAIVCQYLGCDALIVPTITATSTVRGRTSSSETSGLDASVSITPRRCRVRRAPGRRSSPCRGVRARRAPRAAAP